MPQQPQDDLTPIDCILEATIGPKFQPPSWSSVHIPDVHITLSGTMGYQGDHLWMKEWYHVIPNAVFTWGGYHATTTNCYFRLTIFLDWGREVIEIRAMIRAEDEHYWLNNDAGLDRGGCESDLPPPKKPFTTPTPWFLEPTDLDEIGLYSNCRVTAFRPVKGLPIGIIPIAWTPYGILKFFVGSKTLFGPIGDKVVCHRPEYPSEQIPGVTNPTRRIATLRTRTPGPVYTDPGHVAAQDAIASAAAQWAELTAQEKADWSRAGKTCKPPIHGYALWSQIRATKRLDRITTLEARTGLTLARPTL